MSKKGKRRSAATLLLDRIKVCDGLIRKGCRRATNAFRIDIISPNIIKFNIHGPDKWEITYKTS